MPKYLFTYHQPKGYVPGSDANAMSQWEAFFESIGDHVVEPGQPVLERTAIGEVGTSTQLGGYTIVAADDFEAAVSLAKQCPSLGYGGGVQVGLLAELPAEHAAERLRRQRASQ